MTLHIALDGIYVNVNHIIVQKLVEYLTSKSYTVKTIFPLEDEIIQSILNSYDLTFSEKALLTALDRSITWNHQNFSNYDIVIWQTSIISSYVFHTNENVKPSFIKTINKFVPAMDIIVVVQPLQEDNQIIQKFNDLIQQFDNVYPVNFVYGGVDLTFKEAIETIFEVLPTCNWCGRLFTKTTHFKKYCSNNCKDYAKEEQNRQNFRNYYKRYKDTMSEAQKGALGSRGANLHAHANEDHEVEARLISNEKKRLGL